MKSRLISAFFAGKCRICGKAVPKGEQAYFAKHYGIRCAACGPHTSDDQPLPSKSAGKSKSRKEPSPESKSKSEPAAHPSFKPADEQASFEAAARQAQHCEDGIHRIEYSSVREIVEDALSEYAQTEHNVERLRSIQAEALSGKDRWGNYFTKPKLLEQVFNPPAALLNAVDKMREKLIGDLDLPSRPRRKLRRGLDWGEELDTDRWLARDPMGWERVERTTEQRRTVTIGCNVSVHARITPEQLLYRGAAALALADLLTQQGCNVSITLFKCSESPSTKVDQGVVRCILKSPDMPLDMAALTFALCEIAFYRCVIVCAAARRWPGTLNSGLGTPNALPKADRKGMDYLIDSDVLGEEQAVEWLRNQLNRKEAGHV